MKNYSSQFGFTLIEMIVSLALFSGVITVAVGALLILIGSNEQLQGEQSVMTNLSFALDSMTREIRTGTGYFCEERNNYAAGGPNNIFDGGNNLDTIIGLDTQDCAGKQNEGWSLQGVSFIEGGSSISGTNERIVYFHDSDANSDTGGKMYRRVGTEDPVPITSSGIFIERAEFIVTGSAPQSDGNEEQATVTILIEAREKDDPLAKVFKLQTSITQRTLDI